MIPGAIASKCSKCTYTLPTRYMLARHYEIAHGCPEAEIANLMSYQLKSVKGILRLARIREAERTA